jgi:hypothetical protein
MVRWWSASERRSASRVRRLVAPAVVALASLTAWLSACNDLGGAGELAVIEFDSIPYPALLAGDSMRDSLGVVRPLRALAFDGAGRVLDDADFTFFTTDTGAVIDANDVLRVTRRDGTVRLVAAVGGLQSAARTVRVTRRPDTTFVSGQATDTLVYSVPDVAANYGEFKLALRSDDTVGVSPNVVGWTVRWRVVHNGDTLGLTDTLLVALQSTTGRRGQMDTTATDGTSTRRLRVFANRLTVLTDSFDLVADVRLHGTPVPGSPLRYRLHIRPPSP